MEFPGNYIRYINSLCTKLASEGFAEDDFADISRSELIHDIDRVIALNQELRSFKAHWLVEHLEAEPWPDDYLAIGESGSGNYYCISHSGLFAGVVCFDHEVGEFTPAANSLDEFYDSVIEIMQPRKQRMRVQPLRT